MITQNYSVVSQTADNIYLARRNTDKKEVVIKKIPFSGITAKKKQHIVNEVNSLLTMDYMHILKYYDYQINKNDFTVDIVMEFCRGGTLEDLINLCRKEHRKLTEDQLWEIFYQLVQALQYIQQRKIIHRNLDPSHVFFKENKRNNIKLGGFGLAKTVQKQDQLASTILPNTCYLSPEQIETGICTVQTDIWALGCLMYELAALQKPFRHANEFERVRLIKESSLKKLSAYSVELNRVIFWCLNKSPENRPSLSDLGLCPEINLRIREIRYQKSYADLLRKEEKLKRKQEELLKKEIQLEREFQTYSIMKSKKSWREEKNIELREQII